MGDAQSDIEAEAAAWFARLNNHKVDLNAISEFHAWRRQPEHDAAFERIQEVWKASGAVRDDPAVIAAIREAKARIAETRRKEGLPLRSITACLAAALVVSAALGLTVLRPSAPALYQTAVGEQRLVRLADGSKITLDTDTLLEVSLSRKERWVRLKHGQALFDVAHRAAWPFHVTARGVDVRDLGTRFDVTAEGSVPAVTVVQGTVEVKDQAAARAWRLSAGQALAPGPAAIARQVDAAAATRWTTGRLEFQDVSLGEAARQMNRYARHPLVLQGSKVAALRVSGAFDATDTQAFATALVTVWGLSAKPTADGKILVTATNSPPTT